MTCRVVVQATGDAHGVAAEFKVTFSDGDTTVACQTCALGLKELMGPTLKLEKLENDKVTTEAV
jgi:hypothetical protein